MGADAGEENTEKAFEASLQRLGLDYLDLYLIHQPYGDYYGSWRAMRALNEQGMVKAIGVCNFYPDRLMDLIVHTGFTPAVNQIETHPYFQRQADHDLMAERGVQHEAWGGFAEGRNSLFSDPTLTEIGAPTASPSPRSCCAGSPSATSSPSPSRFDTSGWRENLDIFDFTLTDDELARIAAMDTGATLFFDHRDPAMVSAIGNRPIHD